jgi:hypothetical protein
MPVIDRKGTRNLYKSLGFQNIRISQNGNITADKGVHRYYGLELYNYDITGEPKYIYKKIKILTQNIV